LRIFFPDPFSGRAVDPGGEPEALCCQDAVDRGATDLEALGDLCGAEAFCLEPGDVGGFDRGGPALIDALGLCGSDALKLTFFADVGLELGEDAQHAEKRGRRAGINRLVRRLERDALGLKLADDGG
jgi:hypothetical protein